MQGGTHAGADWLRAAEPQDGASSERIVPVLACNWDAVQVYQHCAQTLVGGAFGVIHTGVSATEVRAAVSLLRPPRTQWPGILGAVQLIGHTVAAELNKRRR